MTRAKTHSAQFTQGNVQIPITSFFGKILIKTTTEAYGEFSFYSYNGSGYSLVQDRDFYLNQNGVSVSFSGNVLTINAPLQVSYSVLEL